MVDEILYPAPPSNLHCQRCGAPMKVHSYKVGAYAVVGGEPIECRVAFVCSKSRWWKEGHSVYRFNYTIHGTEKAWRSESSGIGTISIDKLETFAGRNGWFKKYKAKIDWVEVVAKPCLVAAAMWIMYWLVRGTYTLIKWIT